MSKSHRKTTRRKKKSAGAAERAQRQINGDVGISFDPEELLSRAEQLAADNDLAGLITLLRPFESWIAGTKNDMSEQSGRLKAMLCEGWLHDKEYGKVVDLLAPYDTAESGGPVHLCLARAWLGLRDYARSAQEVQRYLESRGDEMPRLAWQRLLTACLTAGKACRHLRRTEEAREYLERCVLIDPSDHRVYLELIQLYRHEQGPEAAEAVADAGVQNCQSVDELRMFKKTTGRRTTISACMMVKNEEELLPGALESVRDWVDEIVVVDTGSTDATVEIAKSYGAKVLHQPWEGNFSKHRNHSIENASCDWVFIIDADERFATGDVSMLLDLINSGDHEIISINVFNRYGNSDHRITCSNSVRFWRRLLDLRYEGIVHNRLELPDDAHITRAPISLEHLGYDLTPEKMEAKYRRTMDLLNKQIEEDPNDGFAWFNITQALRGRLDETNEDMMRRARDAALKAVRLNDADVPKQRGLHVMSLNHVAWIASLAGDWDEAEEYARRALRIKPDYLDPLLLLGNVASQRKDYESAITAYQTYLDTQAVYDEHRETLPVILYHPDSRAAALYGMGLACESMERYEEASNYYRHSLEHTPGYLQAALRLGNLYLKANRLNEAREQFEAQLASRNPSGMAAAGLGYICALNNELDRAEKYYLQAIEMEPDDITVLANAALFFAESGDQEKAIHIIEQSLEKDPGQPMMSRHLADLYFKSGRFGEARSLLMELVDETRPDAALLSDIGNCLFRCNDLEGAAKYYQMAVDCEDGPAFALRNLGLARMRQGHWEQAIEALETYLSVEPDDLQAVSALAGNYIQAGRAEMALQHYERFLQANPRDVKALYGLAECYKAMGHNDSAAMGYRRALEINPDFGPARDRLAELSQTPSL